MATTDGTRRANVRRFLTARAAPVTDEMINLVLAALDELPAGVMTAPRCAHQGLCDRRDPACVTYVPGEPAAG